MSVCHGCATPGYTGGRHNVVFDKDDDADEDEVNDEDDEDDEDDEGGPRSAIRRKKGTAPRTQTDTSSRGFRRSRRPPGHRGGSSWTWTRPSSDGTSRRPSPRPARQTRSRTVARGRHTRPLYAAQVARRARPTHHLPTSTRLSHSSTPTDLSWSHRSSPTRSGAAGSGCCLASDRSGTGTLSRRGWRRSSGTGR